MISATHFHAMIIHFPIALLLAGFLSEILGLVTKREFFKQAAVFLLFLGALGAIVAYVSGNAAGEGIEEGPLKNPLELHELAATVTIWLAIVTAMLRGTILLLKYNRRWLNWAFIILFTALSGSVAATGYFGGQLVYKHAAGVQLALPDFGNILDED
ncbi:MAG TPA: DUF2231 domain-containing protein [Sunxiuqinia sp.]|nr:DUF2231 domain-containing protein [Sunxiuqinia sp.]